MRKIRFILLFLLAMTVGGHISYADKSLSVITPIQAKQIAEDRFGGKALSAELVSAGGASAYRVKLIKAGRVKIVTIPANP